jgi:signal transduction histidine kinase
LSRIIEDLLVLARPEVGEPTQEPVCVRDVLRAVIESHQRQFPGRHIELIEARPEIYAAGSGSFLEHTARNLIGNAEKYSPSDGVIRLSVKEVNGEICVLVRDQGDGILPSEEANIFKPFYRSPKTAAKAPGIGIGLAVSKRLIEAQRGRIWVQAAANGGAEFCFTLPALAQDE